MKIKRDLELHKPFRIIFDGEDYGIYTYQEETNRYIGAIGYIPMESMLRAVTDGSYIIQAKPVE